MQSKIDVFSTRLPYTSKERHIRTSLPVPTVAKPILETASNVTEDLNKKVKRSLFRSKKRVVRYGLFASNLILVSVIAGFIIMSRNNTPTSTSAPMFSLTQEEKITDPLDEISGADIAVNVAELVRLEQATAVRNNADTINLQLDVVPNDSQVVAKPQIVQTALKSIKDLQEYTTVDGDTVDSVATKFGITADSIRWSNGLTGNTVAAGKVLKIPPVNGVVYEVKDGDTAEKIAQKYGADAAAIIAFNDAEIGGFVAGEMIVVPDGKVQAPVVVRAAAYSGFRWGGSSPVYGYNGYDYGYCTWYAANRRAELGKPVPANLGNASTWKVLSQRAGIPVGNTPAPGAVIWTPPRDYYGHVGIVESVNEDGSVVVSEMNTVGWGVKSTKTLSAEQAANYSYIY